MLYSMVRIRRTEEALAARYAEQQMRCPMHLCVGQEAIAVGVCESLTTNDMIFSNHRAHGHYLAKGGDLNAMVSELYGKSSGCCGGRGGSMHLIDLDAGVMGATPVVGGTVPLAVGAAWSAQLRESGQVTVVFFGDGCFEEGVLHESMNFAALHQLPILFVCENNDFSVYTKQHIRQPDRRIYEVAQAHSIQSSSGDGNDIDEVHVLASQAIARVRTGEGPQFLELDTYRWLEHCGPNYDHGLNYRTLEEIEEGENDCPIDSYKSKYDVTAEQYATLVEEIDREIDAAFDFAINSASPVMADGLRRLYD